MARRPCEVRWIERSLHDAARRRFLSDVRQDTLQTRAAHPGSSMFRQCRARWRSERTAGQYRGLAEHRHQPRGIAALPVIPGPAYPEAEFELSGEELMQFEGGYRYPSSSIILVLSHLSIDDARTLDEVREALRRGDLKAASRRARVFNLTPVFP